MNAKARQLDLLNRTIRDIDNDLNVSFEFFPPNSPAMEDTLWNSI